MQIQRWKIIMDWNSYLALNWNEWNCMYLSSNLCEVELLWGKIFAFWFLEMSFFCKEVILMYAPISYPQESLLPYLFSVTVLPKLHLYQFDNLKWYVIIELNCTSFFNLHDSLHFIWLRAICISSFVNCLFIFFDHFFFSCIVGFLM